MMRSALPGFVFFNRCSQDEQQQMSNWNFQVRKCFSRSKKLCNSVTVFYAQVCSCYF